VKKIFHEICDVCGTSLEDWIKGFETELSAEREIIIWEKIVRLLNEEMQLRSVYSWRIKSKVYNTLRRASSGYNANEIINQMPELRALPFFERVLKKFKKEYNTIK